MLYPLTFEPIFKERVWGGRNLERLYGKHLPPEAPIGESWELVDRPGDASVVRNGPLAGRDLHWLMENHREALLGNAAPQGDRFPLLVKLLDAREKLSLQVHPSAQVAPALGGEPKTEMWYIADAAPGAELYVGLQPGITRETFAARMADGTVADCFHRIPVRAGDAMFLPSGRVHAIGAGLVIFEIQQNSDTTFRVFDWNRVGLDGQPRALHQRESLASIDFSDFAPRLIASEFSRNQNLAVRFLVNDPLFRVDACRVKRGQRFYLRSDGVQVIGLLQGQLQVASPGHEFNLGPGEFAVLPACLERVALTATSRVEYLHVQAG